MEHFDYLAEQFNAANPFDFRTHLLGLYTVGSRGYNLHTPESDYDLVAVVHTPVRFIYGLDKWDGWHPKRGTLDHDLDIKVYSLDKFVRLLLKSNPNVLEVLWLAPESRVVHTPLMEDLREAKHIFSSKAVYEAFSGMARGMYYQIDNYLTAPTRDLGEKRKGWIMEFGYNPKDAYRMLHAFFMAGEFVRSGQLRVAVPDGVMRNALLRVKAGEWPREEVLHFARSLQEIAVTEFERSSMREKPRRDLAERFLLRAQEDYILDTMLGRTATQVGFLWPD